MTPRKRRSSADRRGLYLLEVGAAAALLAIALSLAAQFAVEIARTERDAVRRQQALLLADQRLERASARPFESLSTASLSDLALTPEEAARLGEGTLTIQVVDEPEPAPAKRIEVTVTFRDARGQPGAPVRLSAWSYPPSPRGGGQP